MVNNQSQQLDAVFHALADPTRRALLRRLSLGTRTVTDLAEPFSISLPAVSKHIKVLERCGLVRREIRGRTHVCHLQAQPMHGGFEWMSHYQKFWNERLDTLEALLESEDDSLRSSNSSDT